MKVTEVLGLDGKAVSAVAEEALAPAERTHWSIGAALLGRMEDEKLEGSVEAWAKDALDMARGEVRLYLKLWRLMQKAQGAGVPLDQWGGLSKTKALLLDEVLAAGGDARTWFGKAAAAQSLEAFEHEVDRYLSRQPFTTLKFRVPVDLVPNIKAAFKRVLPEVLQDQEAPASNDPNNPRYWLGMIEDPKYEFRCLEALAVHVLQTLPEPEFGA